MLPSKVKSVHHFKARTVRRSPSPCRIATTINALQPHLPSTQVFQKHSLYLNIGDSQSVKLLAATLARLGYVEVKEVKESKQFNTLPLKQF
ncbi:MAG: hypothetical protein ACKPCM_01355 [Pseudanabaena sp.]